MDWEINRELGDHFEYYYDSRPPSVKLRRDKQSSQSYQSLLKTAFIAWNLPAGGSQWSIIGRYGGSNNQRKSELIVWWMNSPYEASDNPVYPVNPVVEILLCDLWVL